MYYYRAKWHFLFLIVVIMLLVFGLRTSFGADSWSKVSFAASGTDLKFFDHTTGKIYIYSEIDGKLYGSYQLTELGQNMERTQQ